LLKTALIVIVVAIAAVLGYAATRPDSFRIQRSALIKAPPERVYGHIADLKAWTAWSPWERKDPAMKRTYHNSASGSPSGKGAAYGWEGNNDVGQGRMEITEAVPPAKIVMDLHFMKPFEARNTTEFTLQPQGGGENAATIVTWAMHGPSPYLSKLMGLFFDMEKMVGPDFEAGLANLKALAEKPASEGPKPEAANPEAAPVKPDAGAPGTAPDTSAAS
jgi:uncharacterized protein YndB with AHSA1/START domain